MDNCINPHLSIAIEKLYCRSKSLKLNTICMQLYNFCLFTDKIMSDKDKASLCLLVMLS